LKILGLAAAFAFILLVVHVDVLSISRRCGIPFLASDVIGDRRCLPKAPPRCGARKSPLFIDKNNHPHANRTRVSQKWRAVDPSWTTFSFSVLVRPCEPSDLGRHASTFSKSSTQILSNATAATDSIEKW
jgi:hypothetical protein